MKRITLILLVAIFAIGTAAPSANAIGVMASWWQIDESSDDGFGAGLRSKMKIVPMVAFDTRVSWIKFGDEVDMNVFPLEATGILQLGMVYGGIGAGYYIFDGDNIDLKNAFGWYLVGGIELGLSSFGVFGELKWTMLSPDIDGVDPSLDDVPTELDADGMGFNVGVMFGIPGN
jgi:hypothetical protein